MVKGRRTEEQTMIYDTYT